MQLPVSCLFTKEYLSGSTIFSWHISKKNSQDTHMLFSNNLGSSLRLSYFRDASMVFLESIQGCKVHTTLMRKKFSLDPPLPLHECREETPFIHLCPRFHSKSRLTLALCTIFTILLALWNSEQKNGLSVKLFCFSSDFDETWWSCSYPGVLQFHKVSSKSDEKQKKFY